MQESKIIKIPDGDAFIEIGETYIRMGVGSEVHFTLDEKTINGSAKNLNWEMDPGKITYYHLLRNANTVLGLLPVGPKYVLSVSFLKGLLNLQRSLLSISGAVGI